VSATEEEMMQQRKTLPDELWTLIGHPAHCCRKVYCSVWSSSIASFPTSHDDANCCSRCRSGSKKIARKSREEVHQPVWSLHLLRQLEDGRSVGICFEHGPNGSDDRRSDRRDAEAMEESSGRRSRRRTT
jgi:hypothetical protein